MDRTNLIVLCAASSMLFTAPCRAQNLLQNGSFEILSDDCDGSSPNGAFHESVAYWHSAGPDPTHGICNADVYCGQENYGGCMPGPPLLGSDGTVYAGFHTRIYSPPYNEAIYQELSAPLVEGQEYTLHIDLFSCQSGFFNGTDDFHVYANSDTIFPLCPTDLPSVQLLGTVPQAALNTSQWQTHTFSFIAPAECNVLIFSGTCDGSQTQTYYYVDNVILEDGSSDLGDETAKAPDEPILFPNPFGDMGTLDVGRTGADTWALYDALGRMQRSGTMNGAQRLSFDRQGVHAGLYTMVLRHGGQVVSTMRCTFE